MKKSFPLLMLLFCLATAQAQVNCDTLRNNSIKFNMLSPFLNTLNIAFEHEFKPDNALQLGVAYMDYSDISNQNFSDKTTALFFTTEYRYYVDFKLIERIYIGPFLRYINMNYTETAYDVRIDPNLPDRTDISQKGSYHSLGLGVVFGKTIIIKNRIVFDLFAGPVYGFMVNKSESRSNHSEFISRGNNDLIIQQNFSDRLLSQYGVRAGFSMGFKF